MRLAAVALATTMLLGCGTAEETPLSGSGEQDQWGPLAVKPAQEGGPDALGQGTLRISEDCVFLEQGGKDVLLVWPADQTTWDADSRTILFEDPDVGTVTLADGDQVVTGGGGFGGTHLQDRSAEERAADFEWVSPPAQECLTDVWWTLGSMRPGSISEEP